ncbi:putative repressor [Streptococcus pneumoniae]|uniref:helix-turn-helix domain-containing protein n=1 Tax=Streptococcus pneumoniae TaxID=1313 RepID=UPI0010CFE3C4|nr:helix-turn-helix transcriptional regulator [Streptococcus pneumoniae]MDY6753407.1 helix-turn-helix transcriptional regulator [Streptococcus pneumoniae]VKJ69759.1 putative repressor [Streptococcus pneumoniae]VLW61805.1 putative repressor [Streptococcus pneumoniae]VMK37746.1 putative repressor [Streptococcus pneumoniae]VNS28734.1 putative repressor [Streptococcus pneumoniae]
MFETFKKIKELAKKRGKSLGQVEEDLGYGRNTLYKIKNSTPNAERIAEIANYFNVSTDYLLGRTDNPVIAGDTVTKIEIDLKKDAAESFFYDGHELNDEDFDLISSLLEARMRNRK